MIKTSDGGYAVSGNTHSTDGDFSFNHCNGDGWILKLDYAGGIEWLICYGGSDFDDLSSLIQTSDGHYIVAGLSWSSDGDVPFNYGSQDGWVLKLDPSESIEFTKCFGGSKGDRLYSVIQINEKEFVVGGNTSSIDGDISDNHGMADDWILKLVLNE